MSRTRFFDGNHILFRPAQRTPTRHPRQVTPHWRRFSVSGQKRRNPFASISAPESDVCKTQTDLRRPQRMTLWFLNRQKQRRVNLRFAGASVGSSNVRILEGCRPAATSGDRDRSDRPRLIAAEPAGYTALENQPSAPNNQPDRSQFDRHFGRTRPDGCRKIHRTGGRRSACDTLPTDAGTWKVGRGPFFAPHSSPRSLRPGSLRLTMPDERLAYVNNLSVAAAASATIIWGGRRTNAAPATWRGN